MVFVKTKNHLDLDPNDPFYPYVSEVRKRGLALPPKVEEELLRREAVRRGLLIHKTFESFVSIHNPTLLNYEHADTLVSVAERVKRRELMRVIVLLPTQYLKSETFSRLFPAYVLLNNQRHTVALASYGADLAWELSGDARDYYSAAGGRFREGSVKGATRHWRTQQKGGMWATGVGGPALGRGYHWGIVDDPVDPEQAVSPVYQRRFSRWWAAKWLRGQRPGGAAIIFVMQRLGIEDPVEYLFTREAGKTAEHWHVVALDEIKSNEPFGRWKGPQGIPETCTLEPDKRKVGQVLAPSYRDEAEVQKLQDTAGPIVASAQRQQRPMRPTGEFWRENWFGVYDTLPPHAINGGKDWDTAYTEKERNSASAYVESFRSVGPIESCFVYIHNLSWEWFEFPELIQWMENLKGPHYVEEKASGKSVVQALKTYGIPSQEIAVKGDKLARATAAQPAVSAGRIYVRREVREKLLYGERQGLLRVTSESLQDESEGLDMNDAFVQAIWRHLEIAEQKVKKRAFVV